VAQIVKADVRQASALQCGLEVFEQITRVHRRTTIGREHQFVVFPIGTTCGTFLILSLPVPLKRCQ
jgi:hypothetical protein